MKIKTLETHIANTKLHYICFLLRGELLRQFNTLCVQVGSTTTAHINQFILSLGTFFFLVNELYYLKALQRGMRNPRRLKVKIVASNLIGLNEYLDAFPG